MNYVTGYYGCHCHPFASHEEADRAGNQVFKIGQTVRNRCTGKIGVIDEVCSEKGWTIVKCGPNESDHVLENVQNLIPEDQQVLNI